MQIELESGSISKDGKEMFFWPQMRNQLKYSWWEAEGVWKKSKPCTNKAKMTAVSRGFQDSTKKQNKGGWAKEEKASH